MSIFALSLIIISACMHATWNFLAKQSQGGFLFVWLYFAVSVVFITPFAILVMLQQGFELGWVELAFIAGSVLVHVVYSLSLQYGYKIGDLSLIYPIARGTGPFIVAISAVFLYGETLTVFSTTGILLIVLSIFILSGGLSVLKQSHVGIPVLYGVYIGVVIASYTLIDKGAVSVAHLSPIMYYYGVSIGQFIVLTPYAWAKRKSIRGEWRASYKQAIGVGILNPFAYIIILMVMTFIPVSHVAPVREISILIGTMMGTKLLREKAGIGRLVGAALMVIGVIVVALN